MKIVCFSDTHGTSLEKFDWPEADTAICAGDFSSHGLLIDTVDFIDQYSKLPYKYKLLVAGNHDFLVEKNFSGFLQLLEGKGITYLQDTEKMIKGIKFYGSPWTKQFNDWAFMKWEDDLYGLFQKIPADVDILILHGPPYGILDDVIGSQTGHIGSKALKEVLKERYDKKQLPTHCIFGHVHESYGQTFVTGTRFTNCSLLDGSYSPVNKPVLIEF